MKKEQIIKMNTAIAKFDGYKIGKLTGWVFGNRGLCSYKIDEKGEVTNATPVDNLDYHESLTKLEAILVKIKQMGFPYKIAHNTCAIYKLLRTDRCAYGIGSTTSEAVFKAVYQFITTITDTELEAQYEMAKKIDKNNQNVK